MRKNFRFIPICTLTLFLTAIPGFAATTAGSAAPFLTVGNSARAQGMGEAYSATASDAGAMTYNPAGLARVRGLDVQFTHVIWIADVMGEHLSAAKKLDLGHVGLSALYFHVPEEDKVIFGATGIETDGGKIGFKNYAVSLGYAMPFDSGSFGFAAKMIGSAIDGNSAMAFAGDAGLLYGFHFAQLYKSRKKHKNCSVSIAARNIGTKLKLISQEDSLPSTVVGGLAYGLYRVKPHRLAINDDVIYSINDGSIKNNAGVEYTYGGSYSLRAGYRTGYSLDTFTAGAGARFSVARNATMAIDYAFAPAGALAYTHMATLSFTMKDAKKAVRKKKSTRKKKKKRKKKTRKKKVRKAVEEDEGQEDKDQEEDMLFDEYELD